MWCPRGFPSGSATRLRPPRPTCCADRAGARAEFGESEVDPPAGTNGVRCSDRGTEWSRDPVAGDGDTATDDDPIRDEHRDDVADGDAEVVDGGVDRRHGTANRPAPAPSKTPRPCPCRPPHQRPGLRVRLGAARVAAAATAAVRRTV